MGPAGHPVDWKGHTFDEAKQKMESVGFKVQRKDVLQRRVPHGGTVVSIESRPVTSARAPRSS